MPEIEIRQIVSADIENLTALEHGYHSNYVWQLKTDISPDEINTDFQKIRLPRQVYVSYPRSREEIFNDINQAEVFLVAIYNQAPVGYLKVLSEGQNKIARVSDIIISAPFRRQGIGSGLLFAAMELISNRNFSVIVLEMQSKNDPAIAMVTKLGFKYCGFRDHYFSNDDSALFFCRFSR